MGDDFFADLEALPEEDGGFDFTDLFITPDAGLVVGTVFSVAGSGVTGRKWEIVKTGADASPFQYHAVPLGTVPDKDGKYDDSWFFNDASVKGYRDKKLWKEYKK